MAEKKNHCARLKVNLLFLIVKRCNHSSVDAVECYTYANSVIESSFASMKVMEVLLKVYLPYSLNC